MKQIEAEAMSAYVRALAVADPLRLQFWDSRGLTLAQLRLMNLAAEREGASIGELAGRLGISAATATGLAARLVRHGLITRKVDHVDRRRVVIELTESGRVLLGQISTAAESFMAAIFAQMSEQDIRTFIRAVTKFTAAASKVMSEEIMDEREVS